MRPSDDLVLRIIEARSSIWTVTMSDDMWDSVRRLVDMGLVELKSRPDCNGTDAVLTETGRSLCRRKP